MPSDLHTRFGQNVRNARLLAGWTQGALAERAGLSQQYISLIESGMQNVTLDTAEIIASALSCELWALLKVPELPSRHGHHMLSTQGKNAVSINHMHCADERRIDPT